MIRLSDEFFETAVAKDCGNHSSISANRNDDGSEEWFKSSPCSRNDEGNHIEQERNPPNRNDLGKLLSISISLPFLHQFTITRARILWSFFIYFTVGFQKHLNYHYDKSRNVAWGFTSRPVDFAPFQSSTTTPPTPTVPIIPWYTATPNVKWIHQHALWCAQTSRGWNTNKSKQQDPRKASTKLNNSKPELAHFTVR